MANTTEKEKAEIKRNHESDMKNQKAGAPWGLKVNKISKKALAKKMNWKAVKAANKSSHMGEYRKFKKSLSE